MSSESIECILEFSGVDHAQGNRLAESLRDDLLRSVSDVRAERRRADPNTQDFGATLVLVLGTPAAIALATAVKAWAARKNASGIRISTPNGELIATNLESKDIPEIVKALTRRL